MTHAQAKKLLRDFLKRMDKKHGSSQFSFFPRGEKDTIAKVAILDEKGDVHIAHYGRSDPIFGEPLSGIETSTMMDALDQGHLPCLCEGCDGTLPVHSFEAFKGFCFRCFHIEICGFDPWEEWEKDGR